MRTKLRVCHHKCYFFCPTLAKFTEGNWFLETEHYRRAYVSLPEARMKAVSNTSAVLKSFQRVCKDAVNKTILDQLFVWKLIGHSNLLLLWQSCSALISGMTLRAWSGIHSYPAKVTLVEGWKRSNFWFTTALQPSLFLSIWYKAACLHLISKEMVR